MKFSILCLFLFSAGAWGAIQGPDAGASAPLHTMNFVVEGYGTFPQEKSAVLERVYAKIMDQTGLFSFRPKGKYRVVIYQTKEEFMQKTGQPDWSGGMKVEHGLYTYNQPAVDVVLAHEITHLIFGEFMGAKGTELRWLNEGLAMTIESQFFPDRTRDSIKSEWLEDIKKEPLMPVSKMVSFAPYEEESIAVGVWYSTVASLVSYLIERGDSFNFSIFLTRLKYGTTLEEAFSAAYPGKYRNLEELYNLWTIENGLRN